MLWRRGRIWYADFSINGNRIRESLKTDNKFEALDRFNALRKRHIEARGKIGFEDFKKRYLEWAWATKPVSAEREQQRLNRIQKFFASLDIEFLSDITALHIEKLKEKLLADGRSKRTANLYLQLLRNLFYRAIDWELYASQNPLRRVRFFQWESQIKPLSQGQVEKILLIAKEISRDPKSPLQRIFYDLVRLALNTGMRKSEVIKLKWKNIQEDTIIISGKRGKIRQIPLNHEAKEIIAGQPQRSEYVFDLPNRHQNDIFRRTIEKINRKADLEFTFHLLRHFFTTSLIEKGVDIVTVGSILGHSQRTTSLLYSHTDMGKKRKAIESLSQFPSQS